MFNAIVGIVMAVMAILFASDIVGAFLWAPVAVLVAFWLEHAINDSDVTTRKLCAMAKKEPPFTGDSKACEFAKLMRNISLFGVFVWQLSLCAFLYGCWLSWHTCHDKAVINGEIVIRPRSAGCPEHPSGCEVVRY